MIPKYILRIIVPALLTFALFTGAIFAILLPALEDAIISRKKEMICELTHAAWNIMANFADEVREGRLDEDEARREAIRQIRNLHYGPHAKDYFWVNDMTPRMIVHPYRPDLEGQDVGRFEDPAGNRPFADMVELARTRGEGYVDYMWQDRDNPGLVIAKISYVKAFKPWGWVIGTGIYVDDVQREVASLTRRLGAISLGILLLAGALMAIIAAESLRSETRRRQAREALKASETRYRTLVESAGGSIFMEMEGDHLYANATALKMLGYTPADLTGIRFADIARSEDAAARDLMPPHEKSPAGENLPAREEAVMRRKDGSDIHVVLSYSPIAIGPRRGFIAVATDISERRTLEEEAGRQADALRQTVARLRERDLGRQRAIRNLEVALAGCQNGSPASPFAGHLAQIGNAPDIGELERCGRQFSTLAWAFHQCGMRPGMLSHLTSLHADAICTRMVDLAVAEDGPAPAAFSFMVMGSQARQEQTLCTDQDNAIIFDNCPTNQIDAVRGYFIRLGTKICDGLERIGYTRCEGGLMASNPQWVLSLGEWQNSFRQWIVTLEARELMNAKIFFDFRGVCGDDTLMDRLRSAVAEQLDANPRFFPQLARNMLFYEPPIGLFGNLRLAASDARGRGFDIKAAMVPLVDYARLYALKNGIVATGTAERLHHLAGSAIIDHARVRESVDAFDSLLQIRLENQARRMQGGHPPDNWITPADLTQIQRRIVKAAFAQIRTLQTAMSYDFLGQKAVP